MSLRTPSETSHDRPRVFCPYPTDRRSTDESVPSWKPWSRNIEPETRVKALPSCFSQERDACLSFQEPRPSVTLVFFPRRVKTCTIPANAETP